mmetsp:Transcript_30722/g.68058  ORF Transcript_30722/g.68058 Transcript_30722/m.68058 type:complete len:226 (-) Transcript_30722:976-1653(-)
MWLCLTPCNLEHAHIVVLRDCPQVVAANVQQDRGAVDLIKGERLLDRACSVAHLDAVVCCPEDGVVLDGHGAGGGLKRAAFNHIVGVSHLEQVSPGAVIHQHHPLADVEAQDLHLGGQLARGAHAALLVWVHALHHQPVHAGLDDYMVVSEAVVQQGLAARVDAVRRHHGHEPRVGAPLHGQSSVSNLEGRLLLPAPCKVQHRLALFAWSVILEHGDPPISRSSR